jgi:cell division protein DivIC
MRLPKWLSATPVIIALIIVLLGISALEFSQWRKRRQIAVEIAHITQQQAEYQQKNKDLQDSLSLLNTQSYKEKIAREQLNLKKDGEIVVNFSTATQPSGGGTVAAAQSNPQKWWHYFFPNN